MKFCEYVRMDSSKLRLRMAAWSNPWPQMNVASQRPEGSLAEHVEGLAHNHAESQAGANRSKNAGMC